MTRRRCSRRGYAAAGCIDELSVVTSRVPRQSVGEAAPKIWSGGAPARCCVLGAAMAPIAPVAAARAAHAPQLSAWTSSTLSPRWSRGRRQWRRHPKSGPAACQLAAAGLAPLWRRSIGPSLLLAPLERRSWPQAQAQRRHLDGLVWQSVTEAAPKGRLAGPQARRRMPGAAITRRCCSRRWRAAASCMDKHNVATSIVCSYVRPCN